MDIGSLIGVCLLQLFLLFQWLRELEFRIPFDLLCLSWA